MALNSFPAELLSMILGAVHDEDRRLEKRRRRPGHDLRNARLVCRLWNALAVKHLFRQISLYHCRNKRTKHRVRRPLENEHRARLGDPRLDYNFNLWNAMTDSETVRQAAKVANVYSDMCYRHRKTWKAWERGDWEDFQNAISRVTDLPALNELCVCFSELTIAPGTIARLAPLYPRNWEWWNEWGECEISSTRLNTLHHVFKAMVQHKTRHSNTIRALSIKNLGNFPFPELLVPGSPLLDVVKDITKLRLHVTQEEVSHCRLQGDTEYVFDTPERREFEPFLQKELLPHFADGLTSLQLSFRLPWGAAPGIFDGRGLVLPNLKTLSLGNFQIAHHDQFDWVLAHTSLEKLFLDHCVIVTLIHATDPQIDRWGINTDDWYKYPPRAWSFEVGRVYRFLGDWETLFDRIRTTLTRLVDFRVAYTTPKCDYVDLPNPAHDAHLSPLRYDIISMVRCETAWNDHQNRREPNGDIVLGDNDKSSEPRTEFSWYPPRPKPNRARETELGDGRAYEQLLAVVRERWLRKQSYM
ncbi:hypothetical protein QBC44DRAFT_277776 [Cladorrhinum sp. PSN332]|nr:hypothetical protein QBC44DRAFT_277776 [Cladorrhinum sp. PSN332]